MVRKRSLLGMNIERRCKELGMTMPQFAAKIGMNKGNLSRIVNTGQGYSPSSLQRIADGLEYSIDQLFAPVEEQPKEEKARKVKVHAYEIHGMVDDEDYDPEQGVMISVSEMDVAGGPGRLIPEFAETKYKLHFTLKWLKEKGAKPQNVRVAKVRGDSMQPTLWDGDMVVIDQGKTRIRNERLFAIAYGGEARVKRLYSLADGRIRVVSDNPDKHRFPDEFIEGEDLNNVLIIGQIIHKMGDGGL